MPKVPERKLSYGEILERDRKVKRSLKNVQTVKRREKQSARKQASQGKRDYKKIGKRMKSKIGRAVRDYYETIDKLRELR